MRRERGEAIVRREVWRGRPKVAWGGIVVEDTPFLLALYMPEGSPLAFADDFFGAPHPWSSRDCWEGHGVLQLQRPDEIGSSGTGPSASSVAGTSTCRSRSGGRASASTRRLELDIVVGLDGNWHYKDSEKLELWIGRGRWTEAEVAAIRREGALIGAALDEGRRWWSDDWAEWRPDPGWRAPTLPAGWDRSD